MGFSRGSLTLPRMNAHRLVIIATAFTIAVAATLIVDLAYTRIDPRVRLQ